MLRRRQYISLIQCSGRRRPACRDKFGRTALQLPSAGATQTTELSPAFLRQEVATFRLRIQFQEHSPAKRNLQYETTDDATGVLPGLTGTIESDLERVGGIRREERRKRNSALARSGGVARAMFMTLSAMTPSPTQRFIPSLPL